MKTSVVGPGITYARNSVYDVPEPRAEEFISADFATAVAASTPAEKRDKAVRKPQETR